ncbi:zinc-binding dehydrogenase [Pseudoalteromonas sp. BDTF-M6]|uniref:zinc-binding dehydrogenase n=1 Tax=Pseudoalteromonas sp. BDTF-M6 TaxID=2796132 RepID=UPI001BB0D579|nr:zinc-binding dehydrogenase [Pseudoalteromonas sp. BDTF-M6]MBS3798201.1 zinc-binding dehydrogenase [Pseudoalteromonas sp. BDTF-M6]
MSKMAAVAVQNGQISNIDVDIPVPGEGQVLVKSLACGICGSDLHIARHGEEVFEIYKKMGALPEDLPSSAPIMLGHEFCAEVVSYGPQTPPRFAPGTRVTCAPILLTQGGAGVGVTPGLSGAYSEYFILDAELLLEVPAHLSSLAVTITEPLAVGVHAVNRADIDRDCVALVAGCGTIGLATIAALKHLGVKEIVASDLQASKRDVAEQFGALHTIDPSQEDEVKFTSDLAQGRRVVIFECVGIHQLINGFIERAPAHSTLVITGVHTAMTQVNFGYATVKEMDIKFSYYYSVEEFATSLQMIASGDIAWEKMCTATVGMDGIAEAFNTLLKPNDHIKVILEPGRQGALTPFHQD